MKFSKLSLILIIIIGFVLRLVFTSEYPASLNWDEVSHGYNAYSILKTGKDEWGNVLPAIFRCYGDFKLPVYIYLTVPSVLIFGLNPFSVRLISILAGSLTPLIIYLIIKHLLPKNKLLPVLGMLIFSLSPGTIFLSRIALEANLFMFFFCLSFYFLLTKKYSWSSFFYGISLFTYNSSRVLLPFYFIALIFFIVKNKFHLKKYFYQFLPFTLLVSLAVFQTLDQSGQARYQWVSILDSGSINQINELRQTYPRFLVNKATYFTFFAAKNYLNHFNPSYLFFNGGSNYQFSLPNFFLFSPLLMPLFFLGIFFLIKNIHQNKFKLILFWLLISPLPSSITRDAPHVLRSIVLLPAVAITMSLSLSFFKNKFSKTTSIYILLTLLLGQILFWPKYIDYSQKYSSSWQYGHQEMISYLKSIYSDYDQILITKKYGEPHEFLLFYWPWPPSSYQNDSHKDWNFHANWYWVDGFDKFRFLNDWEIKDQTQKISPKKKTLLITSPNNYNQSNANLLKTVNFLDHSVAFEILEIK